MTIYFYLRLVPTGGATTHPSVATDPGMMEGRPAASVASRPVQPIATRWSWPGLYCPVGSCVVCFDWLSLPSQCHIGSHLNSKVAVFLPFELKKIRENPKKFKFRPNSTYKKIKTRLELISHPFQVISTLLYTLLHMSNWTLNMQCWLNLLNTPPIPTTAPDFYAICFLNFT
jgi:hypothetical protein